MPVRARSRFPGRAGRRRSCPGCRAARPARRRSRGDHAAVAHQRGGSSSRMAAQQGGAAGWRLQIRPRYGPAAAGPCSACSSCSAFCSDCAGHQLARAHLAQRDAGGDALHVAGALELRCAGGHCQGPRAARQWPPGAGWPACGRAGAPAASARSRRLPMPVMQVSSSENSVGAVSPRRVCVSSRLRRVVCGRSISSSLRCTDAVCTWLSARPCVCSAKASSAAAAAWARGRSSACQACRLAAFSCSSSLRWPRRRRTATRAAS
jgi:hypothetical protein